MAYVGSCLPTFRDNITFTYSRVRKSNSVYFHEAKGSEPLHKKYCNVFQGLG